LKTSDFNYYLPKELIAQTPIEPRDHSRLFVVNRKSGERTHTHFYSLGDYLNEGDLLVVNQTKVIPARLAAKKYTGGKIEVLLLKRIKERKWEALIGGESIIMGRRFKLSNNIAGEVVEVLEGAKRVVLFDKRLSGKLNKIGEMPLPPYITHELKDQNRYQTVYAEEEGSAAAPTAGLHFTPGLIESLKQKGIGFEKVTLHVGLDTFAPVTVENAADHHIHTEWCQMSTLTAQKINETKRSGGRVVAVGTTSVRVIESAARNTGEEQVVREFEGPTDLFITPGYKFRAVDCMITNFHLPKSTLLMMISAFAGRDTVFSLYEEAKELEYRFYSFGDAMMIV
jgi:S-adenosylmethionine:tRNA ribosyltransferase-isomerase